MKIAAGIILIIAAIGNLIGGAGYVLGGGLAAGAGELVDQAGKQAAAEGQVTAEDAAEASAAVSDMKGSGTLLMVFGLFLWVMTVLQIIGAVFLFIAKHKMFIFIVAALSIVAEVIGLINVGFVFWQLFGLVGGVLAFLGAASIGKDQPAQVAPPAAPAA